ncbi:hypothetical protein J3U16_06850 [Gilliamella sp. B3023]|uniref:hypothetical protein n=1 Tax=unclassified Gilliamella TaxID=2685620 RepID=UPI00226AF0D9|nr:MULTISPECIES: hypothetical protein [unclassified Gilliamella]MCX8585137.1 hypothetical protein [Gilliamella sp. B3562]MCX8675008.1 hypothetical protein [Gilliamella sp. B3023]MCX8685197.1 hypothetical protein [Gilliamella sp. B2864]
MTFNKCSLYRKLSPKIMGLGGKFGKQLLNRLAGIGRFTYTFRSVVQACIGIGTNCLAQSLSLSCSLIFSCRSSD